MVRLIDDLLDVSRVSRGKIELQKELISSRPSSALAVETSLPLIEAGRHELSVDIPSEPLTVEADPTRLGQVFSNLLNNAAKYTPEGGRLDVVARREKDEVLCLGHRQRRRHSRRDAPQGVRDVLAGRQEPRLGRKAGSESD